MSTFIILLIAIAHSVLEINGDDRFGRSAYSNIVDTYEQYRAGNNWPLSLMVAAALAYHIEYALNFVFVAYVSPVAFSVCDIARRIAVIIMGAILFNKILTQQNWLGIIIALGGVLWYSYVESRPAVASQPSLDETPLPKPKTPRTKKKEITEHVNNTSAANDDAPSKSATPSRPKSKSPSRSKKGKKSTAEVPIPIVTQAAKTQTPVGAAARPQKKKIETVMAEPIVSPAATVLVEEKKRGRPASTAKKQSTVPATRKIVDTPAALLQDSTFRRSERIFLSS